VLSGGSERKVFMQTKFHSIKAVGLHALGVSVNSWLASLAEGTEIVSHSMTPSGESMIFSCVYKVKVKAENSTAVEEIVNV
jgi:hypothetical protein